MKDNPNEELKKLEQKLLAAEQKKDPEAEFEAFYSDILRYMVSRIREHSTAEDLTQETFFRFIRYAGELTFPSEKK